MENTDDLIKNITGSSDYMKELARVTGNIDSINMDYFRNRNNENIEHDTVIRSGMKRLENEETRNYFTLSIENDFHKAFVTKKNKRKTKKIDDKFKPKIFIKSAFFKLIKAIEKKCNMLFEAYDVDIDNPSIKPVNEVLKSNPDLMDVKNFFGYKFSTDEDVNIMVGIKKAAHGIIYNYMLPMYDVKATMDRNWSILEPMFKANPTVPLGEVKDMLYLFVVAKYRCEITNNNKYYMKLFMDVINKNNSGNNSGLPEENVIAQMDPARFLELLDNINLDSIGEKQAVYNFAMRSKDVISRIANRKDNETMDDILEDINRILTEAQSDKETTNTNETKPTEPEDTEHNDILADI